MDVALDAGGHVGECVMTAHRAKAREVWARGAAACPHDAGLQARLSSDERHVADTVSAALYAGTRVDTTLRDIVH